MRTIAVVFTLALVAGTAPAAAYARNHVSVALWLFFTAMTALVVGCLVTGWRSFERKTFARAMSPTIADVAVVRRPAPLRPASARAAVHALDVDRAAATLFSRSEEPRYPIPLADSPQPVRAGLGEFALSIPPEDSEPRAVAGTAASG